MGLGADQKNRRKLRLLRWTVGLAAAVYIAWRVAVEWPALTGLPVAWHWILPAALCCLSAMGGQVVAWRYNLERMGERAPFAALLRVYFIANLGRYIPGKVWSLAGMVAAGMRLGIPAATMSTSVLLGLVSSLASGLVVGGALAVGSGHGGILSGWFLLVPVCALLALWPPVFRAWMKFALRLFGRTAQVPAFTERLLYRSMAHYAAVWCGYALAVACIARAFGAAPDAFWLYLAAFPLAYLAGYAALFAPGGWGVREGALVMLVGGGPVALAVALAARLLFSLFELGLFAFSVWSWRHD
jgi:hypothetical protein